MENFRYQLKILPRSKWWKIDFGELLRYRELFVILAWRDIKVRYKETLLGIIWAIFQPIVTMIIFTLFFGKLAQIPSGKLPYSLFVLTGLVFWNFFSSILTHSSNSLIENENLLKKVYFPKLLVPLSSVLVGFVDFFINLILLLSYMLILGIKITPTLILVLPFAIIVTIVSASGLGLFASSLNVRFRDVRYVLPFFIQILLFLSPVIYPTSITSSTNRVILALNPMTGVIETVRSAVEGNIIIFSDLVFVSLASCLVLFAFGLFFFKSTEESISDIL
jgi:lipopolysaccharide transport system permease protein